MIDFGLQSTNDGKMWTAGSIDDDVQNYMEGQQPPIPSLQVLGASLVCTLNFKKRTRMLTD
ncbi:hypothetical protein KY289_003337 [Solanum tuberosum]|nr:hypothetical protein KY284_003248 [Solanum tuberosum]KAH0732149.1 hypothetical protein KY289_003337 [Solanum tuberosum]